MREVRAGVLDPGFRRGTYLCVHNRSLTDSIPIRRAKTEMNLAQYLGKDLPRLPIKRTIRHATSLKAVTKC